MIAWWRRLLIACGFDRWTVSQAWRLDQQRRQFGQGIDQACIDWRKMREREL